MWLLFGSLIIGALIGWFRILPEPILNLAGKGMMFGVLVLLFSMGLRIGVDENTLAQMGNYGWQAFIFALATIFGSVVFVIFLEKIFLKEKLLLEEMVTSSLPPSTLVEEDEEMEKLQEGEKEEQEKEEQGKFNSFGMIILILGVFIAGILLGVGPFPEEGETYLPTLTDIALYFTLLMVGVDLGLNRDIWKHILKAGWQVLLPPIGVALGSIVGAMLVGMLFGWSLREGGAVGAGFGW